MLAAVGVRKADENKSHFICKPSELPLYTSLHAQNISNRTEHPKKQSVVHESIESGVRLIRTEVQSGIGIVSKNLETIDNYVETAKAHTHSAIDYLNEPQNVVPRSGAIGIGGLAGFIFAARGGFIRKVLYTGIGSGVIASLCYPRQAEEIAKEALYEARKGYAIAYNFIKGVKPGDEFSAEPVNKFPTSIQDMKFLFWDLYDDVKESLFPKKN